MVASVKGSSHFEVDTATGVAAVRSTDWFIEARPGSTQVGVLEGRVSLAKRRHRNRDRIPARWGARVEAGRDPVPARVWSSGRIRRFHPPHEFGIRSAAVMLRRGARSGGLALIGAAPYAAAVPVFADRPMLRGLETASLDLRFRLRGVRPPSARVTIVLVDDRSLASAWPLAPVAHPFRPGARSARPCRGEGRRL